MECLIQIGKEAQEKRNGDLAGPDGSAIEANLQQWALLVHRNTSCVLRSLKPVTLLLSQVPSSPGSTLPRECDSIGLGDFLGEGAVSGNDRGFTGRRRFLVAVGEAEDHGFHLRTSARCVEADDRGTCADTLR